jgi:ABC-type multidrug transport system ATPase subunit
MELLRELHQQGATVCMVTHDPRYAKHADRQVHLFDGRVVDEEHEPKAEHELKESGTLHYHAQGAALLRPHNRARAAAFIFSARYVKLWRGIYSVHFITLYFPYHP